MYISGVYDAVLVLYDVQQFVNQNQQYTSSAHYFKK